MSTAAETLLPVHGFVLAGGLSSRMGRDKALLEFRGRTMVEIAVEKLRNFCAEVSIGGNRDDLSGFAPVVRENRMNAGPGAGIEAGMMAARQRWVLFVPVDVPLMPVELLRRWAVAVLDKGEGGCSASFLLVNGVRQPAFCIVRQSAARDVLRAVEAGKRRIDALLYAVEQADRGWVWTPDASQFAVPSSDQRLRMECWFSNVNTPEELATAEALGEERFGES